MTVPDIEHITLEKGAHGSRESGVCAMELVAWMAGEKHSDHPACVSPVLGAFLRRWNDDLDDEGRQRLKPYLKRVIGTALDGFDERRGWMVTDWMVRTHLPAWLDLAGITAPAAALRALPELVDVASATSAQSTIENARVLSAAAGPAAGDAACDAAVAAARDAAGAAAGDAAWDAAWAALAPTVSSLQESAFGLLNNLIEPRMSEAQ